MSHNLISEPFSAAYDIVHSAEVRSYNGEEAIIDSELLSALEWRFGRGVIGMVDGLHYQFEPQRAIPPGVVAVPDSRHRDPDTLLVKK